MQSEDIQDLKIFCETWVMRMYSDINLLKPTKIKDCVITLDYIKKEIIIKSEKVKMTLDMETEIAIIEL